MTYIYEPARDLKSRINRRLTEYRAQNFLKIKPGKTIISFSFDDCPRSAIDNGVRALDAEGWLSTIYVACGLFNIDNHLGKHIAPEDVIALHENGHEIGEHTYSHKDAVTLGLERFLKDIDRNQQELSSLGLPPSQTIAYPYGQTTPSLKTVMTDRFAGARGISPRLHKQQVDLNQIGSVPLFSSTIDTALKSIRHVGKSGGWLTLFTHDIRDTPSSWGCTSDDIAEIIHAVKESGADVLTIKDAISNIRESAQ